HSLFRSVPTPEARQRSRDIQELAAVLGFERSKPAEKLDGFAPLHRIRGERRSRRLGKAGAPVIPVALIEIGGIDAERHPHAIEPACADAVGSALVFLYLLECQPERLGQLFLTDSELETPLFDTRTDMDIDRVRPGGFAAAPICLPSRSRHDGSGATQMAGEWYCLLSCAVNRRSQP